MNAEYNLFRNAHVEVTPSYDDNGNALANIVVNNQFEHTFAKNSRISKALNVGSGTESLRVARLQLQDRLSGGDYFFVGDELIDFRDSAYVGFIHNDNSIEQLMKHIGVNNADALVRTGLRLNTMDSSITLSSVHSTEDFNIMNIASGGDFKSSIIYSWSPFASFVRGIFKILRVVCSNGMVSTADEINTRIPLLNRWEEHLEITNVQMQNSIQGLMNKRFSDMVDNRISVRDLKLISKHANIRAAESTDPSEVMRLKRIEQIVNPATHLSTYYAPEVFNNMNIASQVPGHLSVFDAWNCITEMLSHTNATALSTVGSLQTFASSLVFPTKESTTTHLNKQPLLSAFSDPDRAFFGA
jgi:hypothetical protein